ncbi:tyrosine-type recombinase/integrase [Parasphingopyxis algicola]|uniref:tyrosine-type recombinase/integrase n=1 Tax=Parasphingopyxis algicola TaxID=2026624 RepID=UPI0015A35006|nr:site-specific integrase [Parasphingopyxis algicola]QLC24943.1 tyrosine-type recombinase/integrase [Parasphingopyxis algicola]
MICTKITKRKLEALTAKEQEYIVWDQELKGFGVRVSPKGRRSFLAQYRTFALGQHKQRRMTLGVYGTVTVEEARAAARLILARVELGQDPALERDEAKIPAFTVGELADKWLEQCAPRSRARGKLRGTPRNPKNVAIDKGRIERHIKPLIGDMPAAELTPMKVIQFREDVRNGKTALTKRTSKHGTARVTGGDGAATRTLRQLSAIYSFGVRMGLVEKNPVMGIERTPDSRRERYLSDDELKRLGEALAEEVGVGIPSFGVLIIKLLLLTGCRKSEIEGLKRSEIDHDRGFIRFQTSKTGAKTIPINDGAKRILASVPESGGSEFVFPARSGKGHYIGTPKVWRRVCEAANINDARLHDLRHTFASKAAEGGFSLPVIGALLGHRDVKTTARYAHLADSPLRKATMAVGSDLETMVGI